MVEYSLDTPWLEGHPRASITRTVEIVDVNECTYKGNDTFFKPLCSGLAVCENIECAETSKMPRQGYKCVCPDEGYEPDENNSCADFRAPVIECVVEGCNSIHLWAIKGEGAIVDTPYAPNTGALLFEDNVDASWLEKIIDTVADVAPQLQAFDLVPNTDTSSDDRIILSEAIERGKVQKYDTPGIWVSTYSVQDSNGNVAKFDVHFNVTTLSAEVLVPLLNASPRAEPAVESNDAFTNSSLPPLANKDASSCTSVDATTAVSNKF